MEIFNAELVAEFLTWKVEYQLISKNSYETSEYLLVVWARFIEGLGKNLLNVEPGDFMAFRNERLNKRNNTAKQQFSTLRSFYKWAVQEQKIKVFPIPVFKLEKGPKNPNYIPTAQEIFAYRCSITTLARATIFEMLLSSGLRASELIQLRCSDIDFNVKVPDLKLGTTSPYVGASVLLSPQSSHVLKTGNERTTFLSKLAANLLKRYMAYKSLDPDSNMPIFPFSRYNLSEMFSCIFDKASQEKQFSGAKIKAENLATRQQAFLDIDADALQGVSEGYKSAIKRMQEKHKENLTDNKLYSKMTRLEPPKRKKLHPHALRHFFSCLMYFRSYYGSERDLIAVRDLLGHTKESMTNTYLHSAVIIKNFNEWKQVMLGNGFQYSHTRTIKLR